MLQEARRLGDELIVVVARDETVRKRKHEPIYPENVRVELVEALKPVDKAVLGHRGDIFQIVEEMRPDVIALGYNQAFDDDAIRSECKRRGVDVRVERLHHHDHDLDATRKVIKVIAERVAKKELYTAEHEAGTAKEGA
jgi:FAD synthetase